jgi:beta-glucosidase-like glycosyl hydrolase
MNSDLSSTLSKLTPTRTSRAVGAIIKHVAVIEGVEKAISMLVDSSMTFSRDVYDKLYQIAYENGQIQCAMWVATELRQRGWMPQYYRDVKREILIYRRLEGKWKWK